MSKALVIIKSMGIGDLCILISNIHAISKKIGKPVTVLAQENTRASAILKYDPHIEEVIELDKNEIKGFFSIIKKVKPKKFDQSFIYSDSSRLYLAARLSGIKENSKASEYLEKNKYIEKILILERNNKNSHHDGIIGSFNLANEIKRHNFKYKKYYLWNFCIRAY